jgi:hypothetical protein
MQVAPFHGRRTQHPKTKIIHRIRESTSTDGGSTVERAKSPDSASPPSASSSISEGITTWFSSTRACGIA